MNDHINLGINFLVKILRKHIAKSIDLTGSKSGISPVKGNVKGTSSCSHHCTFRIHKKGTVLSLPQSHGISYLILIGRSKGSIQENLSFFFRKPSFLNIQLIHRLIQGFNVKHLLLLAFPTHYISGPGSLGRFYAVYILYGFHIISGQSHSSHNLNVHQAAFIIIGITGIAHVRGGCLNAGEKSHSKGNDEKNGDES